MILNKRKKQNIILYTCFSFTFFKSNRITNLRKVGRNNKANSLITSLNGPDH